MYTAKGVKPLGEAAVGAANSGQQRPTTTRHQILGNAVQRLGPAIATERDEGSGPSIFHPVETVRPNLWSLERQPGVAADQRVT